ncbi:MAG: radical SAM protein [Desulfobacterota bacterium]|nr:radical SAM protein [Thermodesulfobacteriota bacterium]
MVLCQRLPLLASFKVTYQCNLSCRACPFHFRAQHPRSAMHWETAALLLNKLRKSGCQIVVFEGGEPLLWRDGNRTLHDLIVHAKTLFLRVCLTTNGTVPLDVPADRIWVSIDGLRETHNRLRSNSFDTVWENLRNACNRNIFIHYTINRENWRDIEPLAHMLGNLPTVRGITVQLFYPYAQGEEDLRLTGQERMQAIDTVLRLKRNGYPIFNSSSALTAMKKHTWRCREDVLINVDPDGTITRGCYAKRRGTVRCTECGFTPIAEASAAVSFHPTSLYAGWRIFFAD